MVKIRLRRVGKKKQPIYKIVVADSRAARTGKFIEGLGQYNPMVNPMLITINEQRLFTWLKHGAQPTDTMRSLLQRKGLWLKWGLMKKGADEVKIATELEKWTTLQEEKLSREVAKKERRKASRKKKAAETAPVQAAAAAVPAAAEPAPPAAEPAPAA